MAKQLFLLLVGIAYVSAIDIPIVERITAGNVAVANQFPYVISLQQISLLPNYTLAHRCGGALITLQHVLTTASCTYTVVNNAIVPLTATQYRVYAGDVLLTGDSVAERVRNIANFTIHPEHIISPASFNDIGIITLLTPYMISTVVPISLPADNFIPNDFALCSIAGWGAPNVTVSSSNELRYATKYIYNQDVCTSLYNLSPGMTNIHPSMICATSYDIISAGCTGDQGNALVCSGQVTGLLFLSNNCQASSFPEVYTRVSNYTTWIRSVTGSASTFRPEFSVLALVAVVCMRLFS